MSEQGREEECQWAAVAANDHRVFDLQNFNIWSLIDNEEDKQQGKSGLKKALSVNLSSGIGHLDYRHNLIKILTYI